MTEEKSKASIRIMPLIMPMICGIGWGGMAWLGLNIAMSSNARNGSITLNNVIFFVIYPLAALTASLVPAALLSQTKYSFIGNIWCGLFLIMLFCYLVLWAEIFAI